MFCKDWCASSESEECDLENITVKFQISESQIIALVYPNRMTIAEVKEDIGQKFEVSPQYLVISQYDEELTDECRLFDTCRNEFGIVEFCLTICDDAPVNSEGKQPELNLQIYYNKFRLADFITVRVPADNPIDNDKNIVVEIQDRAIIKPFLGGYRDVRNGLEYHDAFTQTGPPLEKIKNAGIFSRDVQTVHMRGKSVDTTKDRSTQAFGDATKLIHVTATTDYVIYSRKYETAMEKEKRENHISKIYLLQRNIRRWRFWKHVKEAAAEYRRLVEEQLRRNEKTMDKYVSKFRRECITKTFPKTKDDFDILYGQVQKWKEAEIRKINMMYSGAQRIAELNCLLDREIQLLNGIEHQRNLVQKALRDFREQQVLKKLGQPVKWIGYRDMVIEMDLLRTQRVRSLTQLYKELQKKLNKDDRLELIGKMINMLESQEDYEDTCELVDLFEREKDLLICSKSCDLDFLRKRQLALFVDIIKKEKEYKPKKPEARMCDTCNKMKPITSFAVRTRQTGLETCRNCFSLKSCVFDNSIYKSMLRAVQRDERKRGTLSSCAFIMQEDDMRYLVEKVWHNHSILSKCDDITELRMPRWDISDEWSPWNTICLTDAEARVHVLLKDIKTIYNQALRQEIQSRNLDAKTAFKTLHDVDINFVQPGDWWEVGVKDKVL